MRVFGRFFVMILAVALCVVCAWAQPRPASATPAPAPTPAATPKPPPATLKAKYEGGILGYKKKAEGSLNFDEINSRLVFRNKEGEEMFSFPYADFRQIYPDSRRVRPAAATVASAVPLPYFANLGAAFISKKQRYLNFFYTSTGGTTGQAASFRIDDKQLLLSVVAALCEKGNLKPQGEACVK
jgi:hypothetical protein